MITINNPHLAASKAIAQLAFIDRSYNLNIWPTEESLQIWTYDIGLMLEHQDLQHVRLELLDADRAVLFEYRIDFASEGKCRPLRDTAQGIELPVFDRQRVADHRLVVQGHGRAALYRHLLKLKWDTVPTLPKRPGDTFVSEHAGKVTGGRQKGAFHVGDLARHRLVVTQVFPGRGYAFARDLDLGVDGVFLHAKFAPKGLRFRLGLSLQAVVVQTPRGLQARAIR